MDDTTILGGALNQLGQTVKQTVKQVSKLPNEMVRDAGEQITNSTNQNKADNKVSNDKQGWKSDEERVKFLKGLYGSPEPMPETTAENSTQQVSKANSQNEKPSEFQQQIADKSPEEQKKIIELRNQLHKENYYDPTFSPKNLASGGEERPAEKVEAEKKKEMHDLQEKEVKKPPPLAVVRERNKAEMFRGAAG